MKLAAQLALWVPSSKFRHLKFEFCPYSVLVFMQGPLSLFCQTALSNKSLFGEALYFL
jgi:hypothetical protein